MLPLSTQQTFKEATIHYLGSLSNPKILLILGRENFAKDKQLTESLFKSFASPEHCIIWYEYPKPTTVHFLNTVFDTHIATSSWWKKIESLHLSKSVILTLRKSIKALLLLAYPNRWKHFLPRCIYDPESIRFHTYAFRQFLRSLGSHRSISIIARSAGGRIASTIADEPTIERIVCLGYPFQHPDKSPEPARFTHLATLQKPMLIIQGTHDEYGGSEIIDKYTFSLHISVSFIDTDHDYKVTDALWQEIINQIKDFLSI